MTSPVATIQRISRWRWAVIIRDGMGTYGPDGYPWTVYGTRRRAERRARRELRRYATTRAPEEEIAVDDANR
jgi:hypothetical protein